MALEERVQRLEAQAAIRDLRYEYCYSVDDRDWNGLVDLFTTDASLEYSGIGSFEGHDGVREFANEYVSETLEATTHAVTNGQIEVDGDTATGRWYVVAFTTQTDGNCGIRWAEYREQYQRTKDGWRIASLQLQFHYSAVYDDGWPNFETLGGF